MSRNTAPGTRLSLRKLLLCVTWARAAAYPHPRPVASAAGPPGVGRAEGRMVEQRDTVRRHRGDLGRRAYPPVAAAGYLGRGARRRRGRRGGHGDGPLAFRSRDGAADARGGGSWGFFGFFGFGSGSGS